MEQIISTIDTEIHKLATQLAKLELARRALADLEEQPAPARIRTPKTPKGDFINVVHAELARLDQNTLSGLAESLNEPKPKVRNALNALKKAGRVEQRGSKRSASWAVVGGP